MNDIAPARAPRSRRGGLLTRAAWPTLAVAVTVVLALARVVREPRFYFADDTERGSFGQWWQLGELLLQGRLPLLDPSAWQAGNYLAEGQWGVLNPLVWLIGLAARGSTDPVVFVTLVKVAVLALMALGVHLLARSFGAHRPWAALAAVLVPLGGFTVYMDAASWSTGLFNAAALPWVWWALRRAVEARHSPIPYLLTSYVLITFGYVFGVMALVVVLVETLIRHAIRRDGARVVRTLLASVWGGALTVLVYLPGLLTAPVSERGDAPFGNYLFLNADLTDLAAAGAPSVAGTIRSWDGDVTLAPLAYIAWLLPLLPLVLPMSRVAVRRCLPLLIFGGIALWAVLAPSHMGPIRWPLRFMPYLVLAVVILFAVAASRAYPRLITRTGRLLSGIAIVVTAALAWANDPHSWRSIAVAGALQTAALVALWWVAHREAWSRARRTAIAVLGAMLVTAVAVAAQMYAMPRSPLPDGDAPDVATMRQVLAEPHGDGFVVGDTNAGQDDAASWDERLMANLWYLSDTEVSNLYTVLPYTAFTEDLCMDLRGRTCEKGLDALWATDETTGKPLSDLMSVSTIVAMKHTFRAEPETPDGWHVAEEGKYTWLLQRDEALPSAGGIAWEADDTDVTVVAQDDTQVTFTVDEAGEDGRVVFSRLDYPGYSASGGASIVDPLRGWLLTVDVSDVAPGETVTVRFQPPAMPLMVAGAVLAALAGAGWIVLRAVSRSRRR
ncbi:hypothetical protein E4U02_12535 [Microbacterium paludicola]|uniref:YfhO family protein n=1 Tax=Microbacterium paludicola TaxID=300019 RepID=A0A4Y9FU67_9MICO|nr:hypothetical protein [Microbacterium paludicola]MBF0817242.1 hypothetical protein [Microbacterium paludicola]TFU32043.1 hypothetical protein E4U02_12535 [Microbacterium paludicola]